MRFELIRAEEANFSVSAMCNAADVSRSGYYAWRARKPSSRAMLDRKLRVEIRAIHEQSRRTYGYPRMHRELRAQGRAVGKHRVARLMRVEGLRGRTRRRFVTTTKADSRNAVAPNKLDRDFTTDQANDVWVGDTTFVRTGEGWLYLAILVDLFSRKIVGWATSSRNTQELTLRAWSRARALRPAPRLHHTDRGSQYTCSAYQKAVADAGTTMSMSRTGNCWDNAPAESTFSTIKAELPDLERHATRAEARAAITSYINQFYNPWRRHSANDYVSPNDFEKAAAILSADHPN